MTKNDLNSNVLSYKTQNSVRYIWKLEIRYFFPSLILDIYACEELIPNPFKNNVS